MEPPQLHAPRLFDPAAEPAAELKRLNVELLVSYTELLRRVCSLVCLSRALALTALLRSALADGTPGYDAHVHSCGVVLANMQQLLSEQRDAQAADALEHALQQQLSSQRQATLLLRQRAAAARQATAHAAARKA